MTKSLSSIFKFFIGLLYGVWKLLLLILLLFVLAVIVICVCDNKSLGDSLYLSFITFLTIGYGDIHPTTTITKIVCILLGFLDICFMGIIVAATIKTFEKSK